MSHGTAGLYARQLAQMLRQCRLDAGISGAELARRAYISQARVSRIETGAVAPTIADIEVITQALGVESDIRSALLAVAQQAVSAHRSNRQMSKQGWDNRLDSLTHLVRSCDRVDYFLPAMLTGLLQTYEYAYASVDLPVPFSGDQTRVAANKVARQFLLDDGSIQFTFLLTLSALSWPLVPVEQMRRQWGRLIEISRKPNVSLRVIDTDRVVADGPMNTFVLYDDRLVTAELFSGEVTLPDAEDVKYHRQVFDYFLSVSHTEQETRDLIAALGT